MLKEMKGPSIDWNNYLRDYEIFGYFVHLEIPSGLINRMLEDGRIELNGRTEKELIDNLQYWLDNTKFDKDLQPIYEDKTTDFYHLLRGHVLKTIELNPNFEIKDLNLPNTYFIDNDTKGLYNKLKSLLKSKARLRETDLKLGVIDKDKYDKDNDIDYVILKYVETRLNNYKEFEKSLKNESKEILLEKGRTDLLRKTKTQSKARWDKRMNYKNFSVKNVDITDLLDKDKVVVTFDVGDYTDTIAFTNILLNLREIVKNDPRHIIKFDWVIKACQKALDQSDIYLHCTCADWKYRYAYVGTKNNYKYGKKELRPADIRNPRDDIGAFCKHLAAILSNKNWVNKVATRVTDWLNMQTIEEVRDALNYQEAEFPADIARKLGKAGQQGYKDKKAQREKEKNNTTNTNNNDTEELELKDDKKEV